MRDKAPTVEQYMTRTPLTIGSDQPLALAHRFMREHKLRHLPVLDAGRVVGIVSDGDLHLIETLAGVDTETITVEEAMTPEPFCVEPDTPLAEVVSAMAQHKYGCTVVTSERKVTGIFTTVDVCRAFAEFLAR